MFSVQHFFRFVKAVNELDIPALNLHKKVLENDGELYPVQQDVHVGQQVAAVEYSTVQYRKVQYSINCSVQ